MHKLPFIKPIQDIHQTMRSDLGLMLSDPHEEHHDTCNICYSALWCIVVHCVNVAKACRPLWCFTVHAVQVLQPAAECITY